ncbi:MAG: flavin reductase family protein [Dermabacter sp.]|nr:flavin reductase family protein [Dermabacter sp.]
MTSRASAMESEAYRRLADDFPAPVAVLATRVGRWDLVTTIDSFLDVSYDPPTMLVSLYGDSRAAEALAERGTCALSVLAANQQHLAERYGEPGLPLQGMLEGVEHARDAAGNALLTGAITHFSLRLDAVHEAATHHLAVCRVSAASSGSGTSPLVRFAKQYSGLAR